MFELGQKIKTKLVASKLIGASQINYKMGKIKDIEPFWDQDDSLQRFDSKRTFELLVTSVRTSNIDIMIAEILTVLRHNNYRASDNFDFDVEAIDDKTVNLLAIIKLGVTVCLDSDNDNYRVIT